MKTREYQTTSSPRGLDHNLPPARHQSLDEICRRTADLDEAAIA